MMLRRVMLVGCLMIGFQGVAVAASPAHELGKAWPNTHDVSRSPRWHVYVFERDGIRYVQVNDAQGRVQGAVATANGAFLVLPMGIADVQTTVVSSMDAAPVVQKGETVYSDAALQVTMTPQASGRHLLTAASTCTDPARCSEKSASQSGQ
jgi:hypothetical protein